MSSVDPAPRSDLPSAADPAPGTGSTPATDAGLDESPFLRGTARIEADARLDPLVAGLGTLAEPLAYGRARDVLGGRWLGHALHPLLTDFPLGCWLSAGLLDLVGGRSSRRAAQRLVGLGLLAVPPTALSGMSDWTTAREQRDRRVGVVHALINTTVAALYLRSWNRRRRGRHAAGVAFGMAGGGLAWVSGYLGGHLSLRRGVGGGDPVARTADAA